MTCRTCKSYLSCTQYFLQKSFLITTTRLISLSKKQKLYNEYNSKVHLLLAQQKRQIEMLEYTYNIVDGEIVGGSNNDEYFCEFYDRYALYLHNDDIQDDFIKDFCAFQTSTHVDSLKLRDNFLLSLNNLKLKNVKSLNKYKKPFPFKI